MKIPPEKDPIGKAVLDFQNRENGNSITVYSPDFDPDEIPVHYFFRTFKEMPEIEQKALKMAYGKVLDVGAAAGCHSKYLMQNGVDVTAVEISPLCCDYLFAQKIPAVNTSIFDFHTTQKFDTVLVLMNGLGIAQTVRKLSDLLQQLKTLLTDNGQLLVDSSDLTYLTQNKTEVPTTIRYQMAYKDALSEPFDWLYLDFDSLQFMVEMNGLQCEKICNGSHYDYLARITL